MDMSQNKTIYVEEAFQRAVNIRYDYGNSGKADDYIASTASLELLNKLIWSTANHATNRANILIGAYGRGKSHMILSLLTLLCGTEADRCSKLMAQMSFYDSDLREYMQEYIDSKQRLLPVIISGNNESITQSFLGALQEALQRADLMELMPETHFAAAESMIEKWKTDYPETFKAFENNIQEPFGAFMDKLQNFDEQAYRKFVEVYPQLTAGSTFNPFVGSDIVDLYDNIATAIAPKGYSGIFVVYDEFSKYLEANIKTTSLADMKLLQDFAEKCTRSGNKQLHLLLITHKDIHNYIDILPKEKTDGWRGIAERFEHLEMNGSVDHTYELIGKVIRKDEAYFQQLKKTSKEQFEALYAETMEKNLFRYASREDVENIVDACYPLHPATVFLLPRISEKVAQNERTLFTFLASDQKNTLKEFLANANNEFALLEPDYIYDYFEQQFKKEAYNSGVHKIYVTATSALRKVEKGSVAEKLIKTLALIAICDEYENIAPSTGTLAYCYGFNSYQQSDIADALLEMVKKTHLIYRQENSGFLVLKDGSQQNLEQAILDTMEQIKLEQDVADTLNKALVENYFYPTRYNEDYAIVRYFNFRYIDEMELQELLVSDNIPENMIYGVIPDSELSIDAVVSALTVPNNLSNNVVIVPKAFQDIADVAYRYAAIERMRESGSYEGTDYEELTLQLDDMDIVLKDYYGQYTSPERMQAAFYYGNVQAEVYRKTQFTNLLSLICLKAYPMTPVINNEMVNKDQITKAIEIARNKIVAGLLETHIQPFFGFQGTGPEISLTRGLFLNTGILEETVEGIEVRTHGLEDKNLQFVFDTIHNFLTEVAKNEEHSMGELYNRLTMSKYKIGMKQGVIPLYLAAALHDVKNQVVMEKDGKELELSADLLSSVNENPAAYHIYLEEWDAEKEAYIQALAAVFEKYVEEREKQFNGFTYVLKAMQRWYLALPKVTKNMDSYFEAKQGKYVSYWKQTKQIITALKDPDLGAKRFLFDELPQIFGTQKYSEIANAVEKVQKQLSGAYLALVDGLVYQTKMVFSEEATKKGASLNSILQEWQEANEGRLKAAKLTGIQEKMLVALQRDAGEGVIVQELGRIITGLRVQDWKNDHITKYEDALKELKAVIEAQEEACGEVPEKREIESTAGKMMLKDIWALMEDDYGESLTNSEKKLVLAELISRL